MRLTFLTLAAAATTTTSVANALGPTTLIPASSAVTKLLSKSTLVRSPTSTTTTTSSSTSTTPRFLQENEENIGWMVDYSIQFSSCHEVASVGGEREGGGGREEEGGGASMSKLIQFQLCPSSTCGLSGKGCNGGAEYVAPLREFMEAYLDAKEEMQNNNGNNNNGNNNNGQNDEFEIERFMECQNLFEDQNNNYGGDSYYTGAYCGDSGKSVYLGIFSDPSCTTLTDSSIYEKYYYSSLPYSTTSLIESDCISCDEWMWNGENNNNNNNNQNNNGENDGNNNNNNNNQNQNQDQDAQERVLDLCQELHQRSAKCESKLNVDSYNAQQGQYYKYYPHTDSCTFIHSTLASLESVSRTGGKSLTRARTWAWIFGLCTVGLAGFVVWDKFVRNGEGGDCGGGLGGWKWPWTKDRREVDLSSQDHRGGMVGETVTISEFPHTSSLA